MRTLTALMGCFILVGCATTQNLNVGKHDMTIKPVVRIAGESGAGSGVVISSHDGITHIITNKHVVGDVTTVKVELNGKVHDGAVLKVDEVVDLALIQVMTDTRHVAHTHDHTEVAMYDDIIMVGSGRGEAPHPALGIVALPSVNMFGQSYIQASVAVIGGKSGGALWRKHDDHYELIGIPLAMAVERMMTPLGPMRQSIPNIAYVIPMDRVTEFIK